MNIVETAKLYWSDEREPDESGLERLASLWLAQVDVFDALPQTTYERLIVKFSPSQADNCLRELYFINTNAERDQAPQVPWQERRRRNGNAYHRETQYQHRKMVDKLRSAELPVNFEIIATEVSGEATYRVGDYLVTVVGRADYIVRYVGEAIPGVIETGDVLIVDLKAKDKLSGINRIVRMGAPSYNTSQMSAYSLVQFTTDNGDTYENIDLAILHYESLQKSKEDETESKDIHAVVVHSNEGEKTRLLVRWAKVVEAIETGTIPAGDFEKCKFCEFKGVCAEIEKEAK